MKHLKIFEEFDRDVYQSHLGKFLSWLRDRDFDLYGGQEDLKNEFLEVANDDSLSAEEKADKLASYLENHWGLYDGWQDTWDYLEKLFMGEV